MTLGKRLRLECLWVHTSSEHSLGVHPLGDAFLPTKLRNAISCRGVAPLPGLNASREILGCPLVCLGQRSQGSLPPGERQDQGSSVQPSLQPPLVPLREMFLKHRQNRDCKDHTGCVGVGKWGAGKLARYPRLVIPGGQGTEAEIVSLRKQDS